MLMLRHCSELFDRDGILLAFDNIAFVILPFLLDVIVRRAGLLLSQQDFEWR